MNGIIPMKKVAAGGVEGVGGVAPQRQSKRHPFEWQVERGARWNYRRLGKCLAKANASLFRNGASGQGLIHVLASGDSRLITKGAHLAPLIVDTVAMIVTKEGKVTGELPKAEHLNAMLRSEAFLSEFRPLDLIARSPIYLNDFTLAKPGYQEWAEVGHLYYAGPEPWVIDSTETINRFLDAMDFASNADRTNCVAAAPRSFTAPILARCEAGDLGHGDEESCGQGHHHRLLPR